MLREYKKFSNDIKDYLSLCGDVIEVPKKNGPFKTKINREILYKLRRYYNNYLLGVELINQISTKVSAKHSSIKNLKNCTFLPASIRDLNIEEEIENSYSSEGTIEKQSSHFFKITTQVQGKNKNLILLKGTVLVRMFSINEFRKY